MAALESQMALLRVEREEILQDLRDIVYPILTLPTDVTSEIFLQYVKKSQYPDHTERNNGPVRLASICRAWRAIALSTWRIWTLLDSVDAKISAHALANCLKFWLPRVGSLPVDLRMKLPTSPTPESDGIIRVLDQHSRRWGTLKISSNARISFPADVRGPFSALTKIAFHTQNTTPAWATITGLLDAPRLREVELDAVDIRDWQESLPWHLLTTLDLWFSDVAQCLGILPHTPNLEHLLYRSETEESPHPSTSISVLPHLKSILTVGECSGEILDYLTLPALETLHLIPECAAALGPLMARSRSSPQILELNIYEPDYTLIHKCISSLPTIRELRVSCESLTDDVLSDLFEALANNPSLIPALESLDIAECPISVDLLLLERMLSARTTDAGVSKLSSSILGGPVSSVSADQGDWYSGRLVVASINWFSVFTTTWVRENIHASVLNQRLEERIMMLTRMVWNAVNILRYSRITDNYEAATESIRLRMPLEIDWKAFMNPESHILRTIAPTNRIREIILDFRWRDDLDDSDHYVGPGSGCEEFDSMLAGLPLHESATILFGTTAENFDRLISHLRKTYSRFTVCRVDTNPNWFEIRWFPAES
ncbi:hypothetical protein C8R43DRAFT_954621 [Mycena crocata]|nr:hypothetical protein C8R43DRAFT_954621 [Mycena crocata]